MRREIEALKQARLKSAMVIGTTDHVINGTFTVSETSSGLLQSTQALFITVAADSDSFLSQCLLASQWDGRGFTITRKSEDKGTTTYCIALTVPTAADYDYYYGPTWDQHNNFDVLATFAIRTTDNVNLSTEWRDNPYAG